MQTEVEDFLTTWLLELRFGHHRATNSRALHTLVHLDESLLVLHEETITQTASLASTFPLFREFGIACLLTANTYRALPEAIKANTGTKIVMSLADAAEHHAVADTLGLTKEQREYLGTKLLRGQCIIKTSEAWQLPILATFPAIQHDKTITTTEHEQAAARTLQQVRTLRELTAAAKEGITGQPTPALAPSSSPLPTNAAAAINTQKPKIALNTNEERLLRFVAEQKVALTTDVPLHPEQVRRAKAKLHALGLLREERIISRSGRGSSSVALAPTTAGYERLGRHPGGAGRGGLQHQYLALRLHRLLPEAHLEYTIGTKRVDLFLTYNPQDPRHQRLLQRIPRARCNAGDGIAIEIESSDPRKTAAKNITENQAAGITITITATLPKHLNTLPNVVDIFTLLKALEEI